LHDRLENFELEEFLNDRLNKLLGIANERFAQVLPCFDAASNKLGN